MTYEEFEWNLLKLAYEDGLERFQASFVAYALGLPHGMVREYLEQGARAGLLEMEITDDGRLEYYIPGVDVAAPLPQPVWKQEYGGADDELAPREAAEEATDQDGLIQAEAASSPAPPAISSALLVSAEDDGDSLPIAIRPRQRPPEEEAEADELKLLELPTDGGLELSAHTRRSAVSTSSRGAHSSSVSQALRAHVQARPASEDGTVGAPRHAGGVAVLDRNASVHDADGLMVSRELVRADQVDQLPLRVETALETYSDPSKTIFMRQLKIYGVHSEEALRAHVERLFTSLGYQPVQLDPQRLRFERGSVTFILALIPLFVLVLPLFVYLFLYFMGRSTIQQEPVELDVQLRSLEDAEGTYEIDLTFIGMHGIVLGAADQRVLNQEVDNLRDELQWALSAG